MSDESFKFTPGRTPKFPALIMRAYTAPNQYVEWTFTPPDGGGFFSYEFEAKQEDGILHINFDIATLMRPKAPDDLG